MQNWENNEDFIEIRSELMTLQEYIEVASKVIFNEPLGYEVDYKELRYALSSCEERFEIIDELLSKISNKINELEWRIEHE